MLVPWITVTDGKAHYLQAIDFFFQTSQGFITNLKWKATCQKTNTLGANREFINFQYHTIGSCKTIVTLIMYDFLPVQTILMWRLSRIIPCYDTIGKVSDKCVLACCNVAYHSNATYLTKCCTWIALQFWLLSFQKLSRLIQRLEWICCWFWPLSFFGLQLLLFYSNMMDDHCQQRQVQERRHQPHIELRHRINWRMDRKEPDWKAIHTPHLCQYYWLNLAPLTSNLSFASPCVCSLVSLLMVLFWLTFVVVRLTRLRRRLTNQLELSVP